MTDGIDLRRMLAGRPLALRESDVPALQGRLQAAAAGQPVADLRAASLTSTGRPATFQRAGNVAIIPIVGVIDDDPFLAYFGLGTSPDAIAGPVNAAAADPEVSALLLLVNSPGGSVALLAETAAAIRRARAVKPVIGLARTIACSAAFWLLAQADEIVATPSAEIGSVGVYMIHYDESQLNARIGVEPTYVFAGRFKVEGNPDQPLGNDARSFIQRRVDETYEQFIANLAAGRRTTPAVVQKQFGEGRFFGAEESVRRGMADRIDTLENVLGQLQQRGAVSPTQRRRALADRDALAVLSEGGTASTRLQAQADRDRLNVARA